MGKQQGTGMKSETINCWPVCCFNELQDVGIGDPLHGIVLHMTSRVEGRLEVNAAHRRMLDSKLNDAADLMFVDAALDCGHKGHVQSDRSQPVERLQLFRQDVAVRRG